MREFPTGATRDEEDGKLDYEGFLSPLVLRRFAEYMHEHRLQADGKLRDADNWQKGIPREAYLKSLFRHFMDVWGQWREGGGWAGGKLWEDALCAMLFNVQGLLFETLRPGEDPIGQEVPDLGSLNPPKGLGGGSSLADKLLSADELAAYYKKAGYSMVGDGLVYGEVKK